MSIIEVSSTYGASAGALAFLPTKSAALQWFTCREQFHGSMVKRKDKNFLFALANHDELKHIIEFMDEAQDKIGLKTTQRVRFRDTTTNNIVYVDVENWWGKQNIRMSFLTALLRCGRSYAINPSGGFQAALFSLFYTVDTKPAVDRFLSGFTHYLGSGSQWHSTFSNYNGKLDYAERMLVKEEEAHVSEEAQQEAEHIVKTANENQEVLIFMLAKSLDYFYQRGAEEGGNGKPKKVVQRVFGEKMDEEEE